MNKEFNIIYRVLAIAECVLLLILSFCYGSKIDKLNEEIQKKDQLIELYKKEIIELKIVEQDYNADKEYIYECYKQIEMNAERSGR